MGFLDRLFGKSKPAKPAGGGVSLAQSLVQQGVTLSPGRCDRCQATYLAADATVYIMAIRTPYLSIDVGGWCPTCRRALCATHLRYDHVEARHMPDPERAKDLAYGMVCRDCGTQVAASAGADHDKSITIFALETKDLEAKRPKPAAQYAAPSGKFSLHKVILASGGGGINMPNMICTQCFAFHPHPIPAAIIGFEAFERLGYDVSADDFEADVGGDCPTCGVICGKHAVPKVITVNGKQCLALHCATHGERLT